MEIKDLLEEMKKKPASLFYGAGVCAICGGPTGDQLFDMVKKEYPKSNAKKFFDYMNDIIDFNNDNRKEIEDFVRRNLASISPAKMHEYLFSLPWKAVLTTNYDDLPNLLTKTMDERRIIVPVVNPQIHSRLDPSKPDNLFCFKILGDTDYSYPNGGWMILSSNDITVTFERRSLFFKMFKSLSSSGHIIYLGYSFRDDVVFAILKEMKFVLHELPWQGFAVTPEKPAPEVFEKMKNFGITWVKGTVQEFFEKAKLAFGEIPVSAPSIVNQFTVHNFPMRLERATVDNTWRKFKIFDSSFLEPFSKEPKHFLEGADKSYYPFVARWDFPRKIKRVWPERIQEGLFDFSHFVNVRTRDGNSSNNMMVALVGTAGSGKTVAAKRISFDWYQSGNPVIFVEPENLVLDTLALDGLLDEIWDKYRAELSRMKVQQPKPLRFLIVADDCGSLLSQLLDLKNHLRSVGKPADILLVARTSDVAIKKLVDSKIDVVVTVDDTVRKEEWPEFISHFEDQDAILNREMLVHNLNDPSVNSSFFALIYTTVKGVQKPLREIILEEFGSLDPTSRNCYAIVSLLQSQLLKPLVSIIISSGQFSRDWLDAEIKSGRLGGVLRYEAGQFEIATSNRIIADIVSNEAYKTNDQLFLTLKRLVSAVTLGNKLEMSLLHLLLIFRLEGDLGRRLKSVQKIDLFNDAVKVVRSRPLLLHLARLQIWSDKTDLAKITLKEAFDAHISDFDEPEQHVYDVMGRLELRLAEKAITDPAGQNKPLAWEHLEKAEEHFYDAEISPASTPHPYQGLGKAFLDKARIADDKPTQWLYLLLAMQECSYSENYLGGEFNPGMAALKKDILALIESEGLSEVRIAQMNSQLGKGAGYAFLAEIEIRNGHPEDAMKLVQKGLSADPKSIWLIRLHVQLLKKENSENGERIWKALTDYVTLSTTRFDVPLSFALAIETFKKNDFKTASRLFDELKERTKTHPMRLTQISENRWTEKGQLKEFFGTVTEPATYGKYGAIECTSFRDFNRTIEYRLRDAEGSYQGGERVSFGIIFNMVGPQATRVRKIAF